MNFVPKNIDEHLNNVMAPFLKMIEPFKVHEFTHERGVPATHDELDCAVSHHDP